jgi:UDP-glucuronate 4-epimerase
VHVIITGGAGFIGSHLAGRLLARGHRVTAIDSFDPFYDPSTKRRNIAPYLASEGFRLVEANLLQLDRLHAALGGGFDLLVHLAARPGIPASIRDPVLYSLVNVGGTAAVLELAHRLGIRRFIFASSSSVYGEGARIPSSEGDPVEQPTSPYAATKRAGELLCRAHHHLYGCSVVCLRLFTIYGPRQRPDLVIHRFARLMSAGEPLPVHGDGSTERDYTHIDDVLQGFEGAIRHTEIHPNAFEIVNLGAGRPVALRHLIALLSDALGLKPRIRPLPPRPGDLPRTWADIRKARQLLGYAPAVSLEQGLRDFAEWFVREQQRC